MTPRQEEDVLDKSIELIVKHTGQYPRGYVAPWWELSPYTAELLLAKNIKYDHSYMHHDFQPYFVRTGDTWTKIDYSKPASHWMKPLVRGTNVTRQVEIPPKLGRAHV